MSELLRITNISNINILIPDLSINLPGKGSSSIANSTSASCSKILSEFISKRWVKVEPVNGNKPMPHWPFYSPKIVPNSSNLASSPQETPIKIIEDSHKKSGINPHHLPLVEQKSDPVLVEIRDLLKILAEKQSPTPEVLAAHILSQNSKLQGLRSPGATHVSGVLGSQGDDAPKFIPKKILPEKDIDMSLKSNSSEVEKPDFDEVAAALRKLTKQ